MTKKKLVRLQNCCSPKPWQLVMPEPLDPKLIDGLGDSVFGVSLWMDDVAKDRNEEAMANGRLVAASLDLASACLELHELSWQKGKELTPADQRILRAAMDKARHALVKARLLQ